MLPPPPTSTLFPYTTLFRSNIVINEQWSINGGIRWEHNEGANRSDVYNTTVGATLGTITPGPTFKTEDNLDRKSTRLNSSHVEISYAVFCLKKKNKKQKSMH